jgi:hypothetical protein
VDKCQVRALFLFRLIQFLTKISDKHIIKKSLTFCVQYDSIGMYPSIAPSKIPKLPLGKFSEAAHRKLLFRKISHFSTVPPESSSGKAGLALIEMAKWPYKGKTNEW